MTAPGLDLCIFPSTGCNHHKLPVPAFSTATICSTENRFFFMQSPFSGFAED